MSPTASQKKLMRRIRFRSPIGLVSLNPPVKYPCVSELKAAILSNGSVPTTTCNVSFEKVKECRRLIPRELDMYPFGVCVKGGLDTNLCHCPL
jgi:hypothetical protein